MIANDIYRNRVERRLERLRDAKFQYFGSVLSGFWNSFDSDPLLRDIRDSLLNSLPNWSDITRNLLQSDDRGFLNDLSYEQRCALSCGILMSIPGSLPMRTAIEHSIRPHDLVLTGPPQPITDELVFEVFRGKHIEPFLYYIEDKLDEAEDSIRKHKKTLEYLHRYKYRSEWFCGTVLDEIYKREKKDNTRRGEKELRVDLYKYLYENGVQFFLEAESPFGKFDLGSTNDPDEKYIIEAKIFEGRKDYIVKGFRRLDDYIDQHQQPYGYYVIYNPSTKRLSFSVEQDSDNYSFLKVGNRTFYFVVVQIGDPRKMNKIVEISRDDLIQHSSQ